MMTGLILLLPGQMETVEKRQDTAISDDAEDQSAVLDKLRRKLERMERSREMKHNPPQQQAFQPRDSEGAYAPDLDTRFINKTLVSGLRDALQPWEDRHLSVLECRHNETLGQFWKRRHRYHHFTQTTSGIFGRFVSWTRSVTIAVLFRYSLTYVFRHALNKIQSVVFLHSNDVCWLGYCKVGNSCHIF